MFTIYNLYYCLIPIWLLFVSVFALYLVLPNKGKQLIKELLWDVRK